MNIYIYIYIGGLEVFFPIAQIAFVCGIAVGSGLFENFPCDVVLHILC